MSEQRKKTVLQVGAACCFTALAVLHLFTRNATHGEERLLTIGFFGVAMLYWVLAIRSIRSRGPYG
ncbi:MAG: hypothetical protein KGN02_08950 [bacterium]|nr:hypothetical protein [bacterium]